MSWMSDFFSDEPEHATPDPRYDALIQISQQQAQQDFELKREQFDWAKSAYAENKGVSDDIVTRSLDAQDEQFANAREDRDAYDSTFRPLENSLAQEAQDYASEGRKDLNRGRASAQVAQNFDAQRQNTMRELEGYGINPGAVRYAGLDSAWRAGQAAAQAAAANQADQQTEQIGRDLRTQAIQVGQTDASRALQETQLGLSAGSTASNTQLATTQSGANTMGTGLQWAGAGNTAINTANTALTDQNKVALEQQKLDQENTSGFGEALGLAAGIGAKKYFSAEGGAIPENPNMVPPSASPSGGKAIDDVEARLSPGEFVIPEFAARWYGEKFLQNLVTKAEVAVKGEDDGEPAKPEMKQALPAPPTYQSPGARALPAG
jgi:hypothetical protein